MELAILGIRSVILHEEIRRDILKELCWCIIRQGVFSQPVIVDKNSLVVLDGMHRISALKELDAHRVPVCLIDYSSPSVILGAWFRTIKTQKPLEQILATIGSMGIEHLSARPEEAARRLKQREASAILIDNNISHLLGPEATNIEEAYHVINRIEESLVADGLEITYETESDALNQLESHHVRAVLMTPVIKKNEVVEVAKSGRVFTPKATRHIIPSRPINVKVPLNLLTDDSVSLEEANSWLIDLMKNRRLTFLPQKSLIEGRRYDEETCFFED